MGIDRKKSLRATFEQVYAALRQADWQHRPEPQPALLCDWGLYLGGLNETWPTDHARYRASVRRVVDAGDDGPDLFHVLEMMFVFVQRDFMILDILFS